MEFNIEENNNDSCKIEILKDEEVKASCVCYFNNTPNYNEIKVGCIGDFNIVDNSFAKSLLEKCESIFKEKGFKYIVGPMNENTWQKYRAIKWSSDEDLFLMENVNSIEDGKAFLDAGFNELYTYTSNKGLVSDSYKSEALDLARSNLESEGIKIRKFNKDDAISDLKKIYNVSKESFSRNPLYTPINEEQFISQYTPYIDKIDDDFVLIAEKDGVGEVGFVFCIPNYEEMKKGIPVETLILKTIAVLPEYEDLAIGNVLLDDISNKAKEKNYKNWIFAFMYKNNTSQKMAKRNNAEAIREYVIFGKEI